MAVRVIKKIDNEKYWCDFMLSLSEAKEKFPDDIVEYIDRPIISAYDTGFIKMITIKLIDKWS